MNFQGFLARTLTRAAVRAASAPSIIPRAFAGFGMTMRALWGALFSKESPRRRGPDDGFQGAGVPARLRPKPPVFSASAARPLPGPDESEAA